MSQVSASVQPELAVDVHGTFGGYDEQIERQPLAILAPLGALAVSPRRVQRHALTTGLQATYTAC